MRFRKLRIAWSVLWGLVAVLVIVLWVRSQWYWDFGGKRNVLSQDWTIRVDSIAGAIHLRHSSTTAERNRKLHAQGYRDEWFFFSLEAELPPTTRPIPQFMWRLNSAAQEVCVPWWCLAAICGMLAAIPWIQWKRRFGLRPLLIAMTLVGIVLGLIAWAAK